MLQVIIDVLNYPLIPVQGTNITVLKLIVALILIMIGMSVAKRLSIVVERRLFHRVNIPRGYRLFLARLVHFFLAVMFILWGLQFSGIPLGIFAFLGGAIAIAVGFGAQEVLANFIGGLILMFEKPIRQGDLIEFDGARGSVEEIGPRCTRILMPGNVDMLVPNRQLLENKLINWTLTDKQVRSDVVVGVAYGSPTRTVEKILYQAVEEIEQIDREPKPIVLFEDFGDNSLAFRVYFWVTVSSFMAQRKIQSDVRFRVDELCAEHGITIAFPQRDVHLDTLSPLQVQLMRDPEPEA